MSRGSTHCRRGRLLYLLWLWLLRLLELLRLLKPRGLHSHLRRRRSILCRNGRNRRNTILSLLRHRRLEPSSSTEIPCRLSLEELRWLLLLEGRLLWLWVSRLLRELVRRLIALLALGLLAQVAVVHLGQYEGYSCRGARLEWQGGDRAVVRTTRRCFQNSHHRLREITIFSLDFPVLGSLADN